MVSVFDLKSIFKFRHDVGKHQSRDVLLFGLTSRKLQKFVVSYLNAGVENIGSMQQTKVYAQKYVLAWETEPTKL